MWLITTLHSLSNDTSLVPLWIEQPSEKKKERKNNWGKAHSKIFFLIYWYWSHTHSFLYVQARGLELAWNIAWADLLMITVVIYKGGIIQWFYCYSVITHLFAFLKCKLLTSHHLALISVRSWQRIRALELDFLGQNVVCSNLCFRPRMSLWMRFIFT